ncbi:uncharacterized protein TNCV_2648101 [Trichonephila clavipes]|nr:uncharacterized protein TNCV_2648101 [Trichonephila clavipes]
MIRVNPKEKFYSRLNDEDITDDDHHHANHVCNAFNIKNLGDYSDLYVKTDVLLLSDIFENFRCVCMKAYNLDPVWYYTCTRSFMGLNAETDQSKN